MYLVHNLAGLYGAEKSRDAGHGDEGMFDVWIMRFSSCNQSSLAD
jgi:hypothetical protein